MRPYQHLRLREVPQDTPELAAVMPTEPEWLRLLERVFEERKGHIRTEGCDIRTCKDETHWVTLQTFLDTDRDDPDHDYAGKGYQ